MYIERKGTTPIRLLLPAAKWDMPIRWDLSWNPSAASEGDLIECEYPCRPSLVHSHQRGLYSIRPNA